MRNSIPESKSCFWSIGQLSSQEIEKRPQWLKFIQKEWLESFFTWNYDRGKTSSSKIRNQRGFEKEGTRRAMLYLFQVRNEEIEVVDLLLGLQLSRWASLTFLAFWKFRCLRKFNQRYWNLIRSNLTFSWIFYYKMDDFSKIVDN